jgi:hypothetical protein
MSISSVERERPVRIATYLHDDVLDALVVQQGGELDHVAVEFGKPARERQSIVAQFHHARLGALIKMLCCLEAQGDTDASSDCGMRVGALSKTSD